ncbi:MAG TPA: hypothetical protein VF680_09355 [Allosphingosinicella sp.]|jgi:hypothetical protein
MPKHIEVTIPTVWSNRPIKIAIYSALGVIVAAAALLLVAAAWLWLA